MIRIGCVNIDTSHPNNFGTYLQQSQRARYTAMYNDGFRTDAEVAAFMTKFGVGRRCRSLEELADQVDVGFIHSCNWDNHIEQALPFIEKGKWVFIDKPIVGSLADCLKLERLAAKGARILGSSSLRYCKNVRDFLAMPEKERGRVVNVFGTVGTDEFNYAIHIVELFGGLIGTGADSCRFIGRGKVQDRICDHFLVQFRDGATAIYNNVLGAWHPFEVVIMTTTATFQFRVGNDIYGTLLDAICDAIEKGQPCLAPVPALTESVRIMLAGRLSRARQGAPVALADLPVDEPGYDGAVFERDYAARARATT